MQVFDESEPESDVVAGFERLRWMPLVLEDMQSYAAERGKSEIAEELAACHDRIIAILKQNTDLN